MSFYDIFKEMDYGDIREALADKSKNDVITALNKEKLTHDDLLALLSPVAAEFIEDMAQRAHEITRRRFGRTMGLYTPLYLSNECTNSCVYCGFSIDNRVGRVTLTVDEALREAKVIHDAGFRDILLVSGEAPNIIGIDYLAEVISRLREHFASIAVEVYPLTTEGYSRIVEAGCDGLTVYQETYDEVLYEKMHPKGKKRDFIHRLETPDRGGAAGVRRIGVGALMGLGDWRVDCAFLAAHASYLTKKYWKSKISVSFPRMRPAEGGFKPLSVVSDQNLVQAITALRIYLNDVGLVLSTREGAELRDNLVRLGITHMSAGSRTNPGGYLVEPDSCEQFEVEDTRSPAVVAKRLTELGFDPVFKDWEAV